MENDQGILSVCMAEKGGVANDCQSHQRQHEKKKRSTMLNLPWFRIVHLPGLLLRLYQVTVPTFATWPSGFAVYLTVKKIHQIKGW